MTRYLVSFGDIIDLEIEAADIMEAATQAIEKVVRETDEVDIPPLIMIKDADRVESNPEEYTWLLNSIPVLANAGMYALSGQMAKIIDKISDEEPDSVTI